MIVSTVFLFLWGGEDNMEDNILLAVQLPFELSFGGVLFYYSYYFSFVGVRPWLVVCFDLH